MALFSVLCFHIYVFKDKQKLFSIIFRKQEMFEKYYIKILLEKEKVMKENDERENDECGKKKK